MPARSGARDPPVDERALHAWAAAHLRAGRTGLLPLGDDAAALVPPPGRVAVVSTDSLVEGTHFLARSPPAAVGAAAVAVSLSDVAAKGAQPAGVLLAVLVPPGSSSAWAREVVRGADAMARRHGALLVGGDTKPSKTRTLVSTVVGWGRASSLAPRSRARPGDLVAVTGVVGRGGVAAGALTEHGASRRTLSALLDVRPRVAEGVALAPEVDAMMDTSDGLAESSRLLAAASRVRVVIEEASLPLARGVRRPRLSDPERRAVAFFGGDYELLAAIRPDRLRAARRAVARSDARLTVVGHVERGRDAWLRTADGLAPMPEPGWNPFGRPRDRLQKSAGKRARRASL